MPNAPPFFGTLGPNSNYRIVRYLYMRSEVIFDMSQIMVYPKTKSSTLMQDVFLQEPRTFVESSAKQAKCCVCNKGLEGGFSITAKNTSLGIVFFCDKHYPLE